MDRQTEITTPGALLNEKGDLARPGFSRTNQVVPPATTATAAAQHTIAVTVFLVRCFFRFAFSDSFRFALRCSARNACFSDGFFLFAILYPRISIAQIILSVYRLCTMQFLLTV